MVKMYSMLIGHNVISTNSPLEYITKLSTSEIIKMLDRSRQGINSSEHDDYENLEDVISILSGMLSQRNGSIDELNSSNINLFHRISSIKWLIREHTSLARDVFNVDPAEFGVDEERAELEDMHQTLKANNVELRRMKWMKKKKH